MFVECLNGAQLRLSVCRIAACHITQQARYTTIRMSVQYSEKTNVRGVPDHWMERNGNLNLDVNLDSDARLIEPGRHTT